MRGRRDEPGALPVREKGERNYKPGDPSDPSPAPTSLASGPWVPPSLWSMTGDRITGIVPRAKTVPCASGSSGSVQARVPPFAK